MSTRYRVGRVGGVPLDVHWSVLALLGLAVAGASTSGVALPIGAVTLLAVMVVHELGHARVARSLGCRVHRIELYPLHGFCICDEPRTPYQRALLAWGGVMNQAGLLLLVLPIGMYVGETSIQSVNAVLFVLTVVNGAMILINLTPSEPFDGHLAWPLVPLAARRRRRRGPQ